MIYKEKGVTQFLFLGWPDLEEMNYFGSGVLPLIRAREREDHARLLTATRAQAGGHDAMGRTLDRLAKVLYSPERYKQRWIEREYNRFRDQSRQSVFSSIAVFCYHNQPSTAGISNSEAILPAPCGGLGCVSCSVRLEIRGLRLL